MSLKKDLEIKDIALAEGEISLSVEKKVVLMKARYRYLFARW